MKRAVFIVLTMALLTSISCTSTKQAAETAHSSAPVISEGAEYKASSENVKIIGRTFVKDDVRYLSLSASAIEFSVEAKELAFDLVGDATARPTRGNPPTNWARYAIYVDGEEVSIGSMDKAKKREVVFSGEEKRTATVKLIKLTEAAQSVFGVKAIITDEDGKITPTADKDFKIEFIGDSITCGYGVEAKGFSEPFTTQTENATKAYAYLTAKALDADYSLVSYSGYGIYSGYTGDGKRNTLSLIPPVYDKACFTYTDQTFNNEEWDFAQFKPNLIVINLGTNDESYCKTPELKAEYSASYVDFLKDIHAKNPDAYILCTLGIMTAAINDAMEEAVTTYIQESKNENISTFHFVPHTAADGYGADWHPSAKTQSSRAKVLTEHINSLIAQGKIKR